MHLFQVLFRIGYFYFALDERVALFVQMVDESVGSDDIRYTISAACHVRCECQRVIIDDFSCCSVDVGDSVVCPQPDTVLAVRVNAEDCISCKEVLAIVGVEHFQRMSVPDVQSVCCADP